MALWQKALYHEILCLSALRACVVVKALEPEQAHSEGEWGDRLSASKSGASQ